PVVPGDLSHRRRQERLLPAARTAARWPDARDLAADHADERPARFSEVPRRAGRAARFVVDDRGSPRRPRRSAGRPPQIAVRLAGATFERTVPRDAAIAQDCRSEEHTSELQSRFDLVCRLLLEKKK